ncbi:89aff020-c9e7-4afd-a5ab-d776c3d53ff2 [Sclerotinia trifoliorum]|uniref:89aff020-c9e7-4afd-a5ab-d776c3d53ff2 n=1 Tax=Sclerotinia trifoliorum TaxID=28548 RepID=A0A8H2W5R2_9HELO|nr:89aff020-c9e7-4afd-a5ab-d776c3d53ff2 [Sclerotinia trifoliorum]
MCLNISLINKCFINHISFPPSIISHINTSAQLHEFEYVTPFINPRSMCWPALYTIRKKKGRGKMLNRSKSLKDKYQFERTTRVDPIPPPYRSAYVVEPTLVPLSAYQGNMYYPEERERALDQEREMARERARRPSCSDLFHNIDVIQRLGERFKGLNTTFSHPLPPAAAAAPPPSFAPSFSPPFPPPPPPPLKSNSNSNAGNNSSLGAGSNTAPAAAQANQNSSDTAALAARIKELEKEKEVAREKEIEKLNGGLNGVRGDIKGLQMKSEREEGRREGRMEVMGMKISNAGAGYSFGESWLNPNGELNRSIPQNRGQDREAENTKRRVEGEQRGRIDDDLLLRRINDGFSEARTDRLVDAERYRDMLVARDMDNERGFRMNRFEERVEGRVERVEDRVERIVGREIGRTGAGDRDRDRGRRERSQVSRERYARPRIMRERERDWEYGYESGSGYGGTRYRGYV